MTGGCATVLRMKPIRVEERRIKSFDGTDIAYHIVGEGMPVLLCNGLGGSWKAWSHQLNYFSDRYKFISWDYRGLYRSGPPPSRDALRIEDQTRDAMAILDAEKISRTAVFGWSMGVQVSLELFRRAPERIASLVLVNGSPGRPWESVLGLEPMKHLMPGILQSLQCIPSVVQLITRYATTSPESLSWAKRLGMTAKTLDEALFAEIAGGFADLDMGLYMRTLEMLGEHDARDILHEIDVPTLVIAGDQDMMTPKNVMQLIVDRVKGAEMMVIPGATHYVAVEYPEVMNLRIDKFFQERGYTPDAAQILA